MAKEYTGVIDRFEDGKAVVLLESRGVTVDEVLLEREELPEDAQEVDAVLQLEFDANEITEIAYDASETKQRKEDVKSQFERLSERPPSSDSEE